MSSPTHYSPTHYPPTHYSPIHLVAWLPVQDGRCTFPSYLNFFQKFISKFISKTNSFNQIIFSLISGMHPKFEKCANVSVRVLLASTRTLFILASLGITPNHISCKYRIVVCVGMWIASRHFNSTILTQGGAEGLGFLNRRTACMKWLIFPSIFWNCLYYLGA